MFKKDQKLNNLSKDLSDIAKMCHNLESHFKSEACADSAAGSSNNNSVLIPSRVLAMRLNVAAPVEELAGEQARLIPGSDGVYVTPSDHLMRRNTAGQLEQIEREACSCCERLMCPTDDEDGLPRLLDVVFDAYIGPVPDGFTVMPLDLDQQNCRLDNLVLAGKYEDIGSA